LLYKTVKELTLIKNLFLTFIILLTGIACSRQNDNQNISTANYKKKSGEILLEIKYIQGTKTSYSNIYTIWLENPDLNYIQNLSVCQKLIKGGLTGTALPYWKMNRYPLSDKDEIDAVTGATIADRDFTVTALIKNPEIKKFNIYCEVDRSFDPNDWFKDQPAVLYCASVDLNKSVNEYELKPCGWTPNEITENTIANTPMGILQKDMRYIENFKTGAGSGDIDVDRRATNMVKKITLKIIR